MLFDKVQGNYFALSQRQFSVLVFKWKIRHSSCRVGFDISKQKGHFWKFWKIGFVFFLFVCFYNWYIFQWSTLYTFDTKENFCKLFTDNIFSIVLSVGACTGYRTQKYNNLLFKTSNLQKSTHTANMYLQMFFLHLRHYCLLFIMFF